MVSATQHETAIKFTVVDAASIALDSIQKKVGDVGGSFSKLQAGFAALGTAAAFGGIAASIKVAIDAADALEELSQKTGIAVEQLSALDFAMRREGVSTEAFAKGMKGLAKSMLEAGDASSKTGQLFRALGVDAGAGPREALLQIAAAFEKLPDGITKTNIAGTIFGEKIGMELIPALNLGRRGIEDLEETARRLGVTFSTETAQKAAAFKDNMFVLQESSKKLGFALAEIVLPKLTEISKVMLVAAENGGVLKAALEGLRLGFAEIFFGDANKNRISELRDEIAKFEKIVSDGGLNNGLFKNTFLDEKAVRDAKVRIAELRKELSGLLSFEDATKPAAKPGGGAPKAVSPDIKAMMDRIDALLRGGGGASSAVDTFGKELEALLLRLDAASAGFAQDFPKAMVVLNTALADGRIGFERYAEAVGALVEQQPAYKAAQQARIDAAKEEARAFDEAERIKSASEATTEGTIRAIREQTETLQFETSIMELSNAERTKAIALRQLEKAGIDTSAASVQGFVNRLRDQVAAQEDARTQTQNLVGVWDEIASRGSNFFADLVFDGKNAFKNLERSLKDFARELIAVFAKRYILNMAASLTNNPSLAALAGQQGQGTLAGSLGNFGTFGSLLSSGGGMLASGLNTIGLGGASQFVGGLTGSIAGPALPGTALAAGQGIGSMFAAAGPYLAAAAAVYALYQAFNDGPENWKGRLGFGSMANAYTNNGIFGREGFAYIEGTDSVNQSIQQFMASTGAIDRQLSRNLTEEQIATITARIAANTGAGSRRSDGQSAEFAFERDDSTAAGQLTLEYLKQKYGPVFDEIDGEFAEFIRGYTGKSEDLLKAIADFAGVLEGLDSLSVAGLDITALRAMQLEGEELTATFTRVAGAVSNYRQLFTTEAEALGLAQASIAAGFAEIGLAIPASKEEFKRLVEGLDLTTEAGRTAFQALMNVAPAFAAVADAAAGLLSDFDSIMSRLRPGYSGQVAQQGLETAARRFQELNPWAAGMDWRYIAQQITTITREDFQAYDAESQRLINQILDYSAELADAGGSVQDFRGSIEGAAGAVNDYVSAMMSARDGIKDWLGGIFLSDLSPLTPSQRFDFAGNAYVENLMKAQAGDIGALTDFTGFADAYLREARSYFASGEQYQRIFAAITGQAANLAGLSDARPYTAADSQKSTAAIVQAIKDLQDQVARLDRSQAAAVNQQTAALAAPLGV